MLTKGINKENLLDLLVKAKNKAHVCGRVVVSLAQPYPGGVSTMDIFLNPFPEKRFSMFWSRPADGFSIAGTGAAAVLSASGNSRFDEVKRQYRQLMDCAVVAAPPLRGVGPILMGGFRYDTAVKKDEFWHEFPDALLTLPRFVLTESGPDAWLTVNTVVVPETELDIEADTILDDLNLVECPRVRENEQPQVFQLAQGTKAEWKNHVNAALQAINNTGLSKVVLSRRKILHARGMFSLDAALQRLCDEYPECSVFAVNSGETTFIGASPEDLASVEEKNLSVACLASSTARGAEAEEDALLQDELFKSRKERAEHEAVTTLVADEMKELCTGIAHDFEPRPMKLKNIQHMLTRFCGTLKPGVEILDAVERLHPTPAVAGLPTGRGLKLINETEGDRGWYASPVGWLDNSGEGEFAVGIRSALVDGNRAFLYAGCGIVNGSDPDKEYVETELKFEPMMNALGCSRNVV